MRERLLVILMVSLLLIIGGCKQHQAYQNPKWTKEDLEDIKRIGKFRENTESLKKRNWEILEEKNNKQYKKPVKIHLYCCDDRYSMEYDYPKLYEQGVVEPIDMGYVLVDKKGNLSFHPKVEGGGVLKRKIAEINVKGEVNLISDSMGAKFDDPVRPRSTNNAKKDEPHFVNLLISYISGEFYYIKSIEEVKKK